MSMYWTEWTDNPFDAIKQIAAREAIPIYDIRSVLANIIDWQVYTHADFLDEVLREIADNTDIVCQRNQKTGMFRAAFDRLNP